MAYIRKGETRSPAKLARQLIDMQYERNDFDLARGRFRIRGDTMEILPAYEEVGIRIEFWGDEVERIVQLDPLTGEMLAERDDIEIYPAKHFVTSQEKLLDAMGRIETELAEQLVTLNGQGKLLEAQRLESRTNYDLEMMRETGYCAGVENYSRPLSGREPGSAPFTLLDYFPEDFLLFIDESHMTLPQIRAMYGGDRSRKTVLVDYGFRLPSAMDNRPLNFGEFEERVNQTVYVSATPGPYEYEHSQQMIEQVIRPTGLIDPLIEVKPTKGQIDDLLYQIGARVDKGQRTIVTTLTKRMSEELADYLREMGIRTHYMHSEIDTLERSEILRDLRLGVYDVIVGINLMREGLDLPEVSFIAILDADKEGYLRSTTALIQTVGRAARHIDGHVIMYADRVTDSMKRAIDETERRRTIQESYNRENGISPQSIQKSVHDITERVKAVAETRATYMVDQGDMPKDDLLRLIKDLESQMKTAARAMEFEKAALLRDQITDLRKVAVE
jgi:excinuclease ABC subunit B